MTTDMIPGEYFFDGEAIELNAGRATVTLKVNNTGDRPVQANEPTLFEIWVCADGYWTDLTKNICPGELTPRYHKLADLLLGIFQEAAAFARDGAPLPELSPWL